MNSFDDEVCEKKFVDYISKLYLSGKTEDKILTESISVTNYLLDKGYYDIWTLDLYKEYSEARERGISPQFARGMIFDNKIYIPANEENRKELSNGIDNELLFPKIEEFNHIIVANKLVIANELSMAKVKQKNLILGFCFSEIDIKIASFMYNYNRTLGDQYRLDTKHIDGYQYTLVRRK